MKLVCASKGYATVALPFQEKLADAAGGFDRTVIAALLDTACGAVAVSMFTSLAPVATLNLRIDYLSRAAKAANISAQAKVTGLAEGRIWVDARACHLGQDVPLALVRATCTAPKAHTVMAL